MKVGILFTNLVLSSMFAHGQDPAPQQAQTKEKAIVISSYAEIYYLFNFNRPLSNDQPTFIYNYNRHNEVNLNLGYIKAAYNKQKLRANLALMAGTYTQANLAAEPEVLRHLFEANIGVKISATKNLWLDAGIFPSHIGFESAIGKDNYTLTRSLPAENSPYYEAGLKIGYTSGKEKWYLAAFLLNGWQRIRRPGGNSTPAFGSQVIYKPSSAVTLNSGSFIGNDEPDSMRRMRYFHNFYSIFKISNKFSFVAGIDVGAQQQSKGSSHYHSWYSPIVVGKFKVSEKLSMSLRAEFYNDKHKAIITTITGNELKAIGFSANLDYAIENEVLWRLEIRHLKNGKPVFETHNNSHAYNTTMVSTSLSVSW